MSFVAQLLDWSLGLLATDACSACDARLASPAVFCAGCAQAVVRCRDTRIGPARVASYGAYGGPLADALRRLKYRDRPDLARPLGALLRYAAQASDLRAGRVVPVPLHPLRLAERRYNQAALLAARVREQLGGRLEPTALARTRHTPAQSGLNADERAANLKGAFALVDPQAIAGAHVCLVDDVITTGATVRACTAVLLDGGAASVTALAVARVE